MYIEEISTGIRHKIVITQVDLHDYERLTPERFFFDWKKEKYFEVLKLYRVDINDILGVISIQTKSDEWYHHIRLLSVSIENAGYTKIYDRIVGNLITYVSKRAIEDFGEKACVTLVPKTKLMPHYIQKYHFIPVGNVLCLTIPEIFTLIEEYDHD
ncbi:MAG TPA: N-acetyltransferase [Bacteroidetes bacterium]|nr:N-acetyltransferase [Bacteroidota bacterium]